MFPSPCPLYPWHLSSPLCQISLELGFAGLHTAQQAAGGLGFQHPLSSGCPPVGHQNTQKIFISHTHPTLTYLLCIITLSQPHYLPPSFVSSNIIDDDSTPEFPTHTQHFKAEETKHHYPAASAIVWVIMKICHCCNTCITRMYLTIYIYLN